MIRKRAIRTGDGTHMYAIEARKKEDLCVPDNNNEGETIRDLDHFWGWDDPAMTDEDRSVLILHRKHE